MGMNRASAQVLHLAGSGRRDPAPRRMRTMISFALHQKEVNVARNRIASGLPALLILVFLGGCGSVTVRHVPEPPSLASSQVPELRGTPPLDIKAGQASAAEIEVGTVGVGTVVGNLRDWTGATVAFVKAELSRAGATVSPGASKVLTLTVSKAQVRAVPIVGGATGTIAIAVNATNGPSAEFEGSASSLAPLRAINAAAAEAVQLMLADPAIIAFLRR